MDKEVFWNIIRESRQEAGQDDDSCLKALENHLSTLTVYELCQYREIFDVYHTLAYKAGLWDAASAIQGGCSDDGFTDFRSWLISQGKEVYLAALRDPDSLADLELPECCEFEVFAYVPDKVYEKKYEKKFLPEIGPTLSEQQMEELRKEIQYAPGIEQKRTSAAVRAFIPRLIVKCRGEDALEYFDSGWADQDEPLCSFEPKTAKEIARTPSERFAAAVRNLISEYNNAAMDNLIDYARDLDIEGVCDESEFFTKSCEELENVKQQYGEGIARKVLDTATEFTLNYFEIPEAAKYFSQGFSQADIIESVLNGEAPMRDQGQKDVEMNM